MVMTVVIERRDANDLYAEVIRTMGISDGENVGSFLSEEIEKGSVVAMEALACSIALGREEGRSVDEALLLGRKAASLGRVVAINNVAME
jgi:hypothetical protein